MFHSYVSLSEINTMLTSSYGFEVLCMMLYVWGGTIVLRPLLGPQVFFMFLESVLNHLSYPVFLVHGQVHVLLIFKEQHKHGYYPNTLTWVTIIPTIHKRASITRLNNQSGIFNRSKHVPMSRDPVELTSDLVVVAIPLVQKKLVESTKQNLEVIIDPALQPRSTKYLRSTITQW